MPAYKKYLPLIGLLLTATLAGCGSSGGGSQTLPQRDDGPAQEINETYQQGVHASQLDFEGSCFACHATEGSDLLKTVAGTGSAEYNLCVSCHIADTIPNFPASHNVFIAAYADSKNACTQCHDPHAGTKFAQDAVDITTQWAGSGHGDAASFSFTYGGFGADCLTCHSGPVFAQTVEGATDIDTSGGGQVIGCGACHDLTARNNDGAFELGALRPIPSVTFPSGAEVSIDAGNNLCLTCHQGRSSTPTVDERIADGNLAFSNIHYAPAGATLFGSDVQGGYEYEGRTYAGRNGFDIHTLFDAPELTTCTGCHMGSALDHSFTVALETCQSCHPGGDSFQTMGSIVGGYDGGVIINYTQISQSKVQLLNLLVGSGVVVEPGFPYYSSITTPNQLKAAYNLQFSSKDNAGYIHNGTYIKQLLYDSIISMGGTPDFPRP